MPSPPQPFSDFVVSTFVLFDRVQSVPPYAPLHTRWERKHFTLETRLSYKKCAVFPSPKRYMSDSCSVIIDPFKPRTFHRYSTDATFIVEIVQKTYVQSHVTARRPTLQF